MTKLPQAKKNQPAPEPQPAGLMSVERLTFLIDGVFAITLTLLVLDLRPPEVAAAGLASGLRSMLPRLAIYLLAFFTIANQWSIHFQSFRHVRRADGTLVWLSLANLLFVTLLPASTAIVGRFPYEPLAAACFSANSLLMSLSVMAIWAYVYRRRATLAPETDPRVLRGIALVWLYVSAGLAVSLVVGFFSTVAAFVVWVVWPWLVTFWWMRRRKSLPQSFIGQR